MPAIEVSAQRSNTRYSWAGSTHVYSAFLGFGFQRRLYAQWALISCIHTVVCALLSCTHVKTAIF